MKRFIFGTTDLAENLLYNLKAENVDIDGFIVEQKYKIGDSFGDYSIYCWENFQLVCPPGDCGIYICIGYTAMNSQRKRIFDEVKKAGYTILGYVSPRACVMTEDIGEGCLIFEQSYLGPYTRLGKGNVLYPMCMLAHHSTAGDFNYFSISASVAGKVTIGDECFFGNNCSTKDKIKICSRVLIGAGAYISSEVPEGAVIVPAKSVLLPGKESTDFL